MPPSFEDIDSKVEKAQGDKARFLKSKEGLLPHFEFPTGETKEEKQFSKETLLADMYEEKIDQMKEAMQSPILLENVYREFQSDATKRLYDPRTLDVLSALKTTNTFSCFSPERQNEINSYLENPILFESMSRYMRDRAIEGSEKEGENTKSASLVFKAFSALITTHLFSRFSPKQQNKIMTYLENPIVLENTYLYLQHNAMRGALEEGESIDHAFFAFLYLSVLISTRAFSHLSLDQQNEINSYLENPVLIENTFRHTRNNIAQGSKKEGERTSEAFWAFDAFSSLIIVKDYLREKGKKIDDENFAKEALNPTEKIPPRPEGVLGK